jgi:hypothetical protein
MASPGTGEGTEMGPEQDVAAELAKWKALAKSNQAKYESNAEAAKRLAAIEESQKTEQQKLIDRATAAERRAEQAELRVLRAEVASAKGLPASMAQRLQGSDRDALEADADALLKDIPSPNGRPKTPPADAVAGKGQAEQGGKGRDVFASAMKGAT